MAIERINHTSARLKEVAGRVASRVVDVFTPRPPEMVTAVSPVFDEEREELEGTTLALLDKPDFQGEEFDQFASNMIRLAGGVEKANVAHSRMIRLPAIGKAIGFYRYTETPWDFSSMEIAPLDFMPRDENVRARLGSLTEPIATESVTWGKNFDKVDDKTGKTRPVVRYPGFLPASYEYDSMEVTFDSYSAGHTITHELDEDGSVPYDISEGRVQELCREVFGQYRNQRISHTRMVEAMGLSEWPPHVRSVDEIQRVRGNDRWSDPRLAGGQGLVYKDPITQEIIGYK